MRPFRDSDTFSVFRNLVEKVITEINSLENEYFLKASPTELEQYYLGKVHIEPLALHSNDRYIKSQTGTHIDVSHDFRRDVFPGERAAVKGTKVDIAIPFEGDPLLWRIRPTTCSLSGYPELEIRENEVVFSISFPDDSAEPDRLRLDIERNINSLEDAVDNLKRDVESHNNSAPKIILQALCRKRELSQSAIGAVAALGIPIKKKDTEPTFTIPAKRREQPAKRPSVAVGKYESEPILDEKEYQHILEILRSMSLVIERNPLSFASLDEEAIRDHFLIQLNGHYEGSATGETFNASGKTDILIRVENKNVFIAECKFWRGSKAFDEAIDQLLGYLTWRDSKCALLVFNRTKNSTVVREKMHQVFQARREHRKIVFHHKDGDSRYILVRESNPGREVIVTTQLYDILSKE
jgi:hypothetical protein